LTHFSDDMLRLRQDVKSLESALDCERRQRLNAFQEAEATMDQLALSLDRECSNRSADFEKLAQLGRDRRRSSEAGLELTRSCITSIKRLSCALEWETKDRLALEVSVHQAMEVMERECQDWKHDVSGMKDGLKTCLIDLRTELDGAHQRIERELGVLCQDLQTEHNSLSGLCQELQTERRERQEADEDMRQQFDEHQIQLCEISMKLNSGCTKPLNQSETWSADPRDLEDVCDYRAAPERSQDVECAQQ